MNILFLSRWFPFPPDNGSRQRVYHLLRFLGAAYTVHLLAFHEAGTPEPEHIAAIHPFCRSVTVVPWPGEPRPGTLRLAVDTLSAVPRSVVWQHSAEMAAQVDRLAAQNHFDLVVASQIDMTPYARRVKGPARLFEEAEIGGFVDRLRQPGPFWKRARVWLTCLKQYRYFAATLRQFDGCTVVSAREQAELRRLAPGLPEPEIVPNGVDWAACQGYSASPVPGRLVYAGALTYSANLDAVGYFLQEIFPEIHLRCPLAHLVVTGAVEGLPPGRLPQDPALTLTGCLPDVRPAIAQSWASVVPLRQGGGTRLKILESLALGTPVVATPKGAEGLDLHPGRDLLVAGEPQGFAEAAAGLLASPELRQQLSQAGRAAAAPYDWERIGPRFVAYADRVAATQRKGQPGLVGAQS